MNCFLAYATCEGCKICEDAFVYFWNYHKMWGAHSGLTSAPSTNLITRWDGIINSLCPASGRVVNCIDDGGFRIVVTDLLCILGDCLLTVAHRCAVDCSIFQRWDEGVAKVPKNAKRKCE